MMIDESNNSKLIKPLLSVCVIGHADRGNHIEIGIGASAFQWRAKIQTVPMERAKKISGLICAI